MLRKRVIVLTSWSDQQFIECVLRYLLETGALITVVDTQLLPVFGLTFQSGPHVLDVWYGDQWLTEDPANTTVYFGKVASPSDVQVPEDQPASHVRQLLTYSWRDMLVALSNCGMNWVSPYAAIRESSSKPLQLMTAERLLATGSFPGVFVPEWTASSDSVQAARNIRELWARHGVCLRKPLESGKYELDGKQHADRASLLVPGEFDPDSDFGFRPSIFERYVPGRHVTAQVMGAAVFGAEFVALDDGPIPAHIVDVHEAADKGLLKVIGHELPPAVAQFCRELPPELKLRAGRIDFMLDALGYWFLECNGVGLWQSIQEQTGQLVGQALVRMLVPGR